MGLNQNSEPRATFLSIVEGKIVKRVPEGTPHAQSREIEYEGTKRLVWELRYSTLDGYITGVEIKEGDKFGDAIYIKMEDNGDQFAVNLNMNGREAKSFMMALPNINLVEKVQLNPYNYIKKGETQPTRGMGVNQLHGTAWKKVDWFYNENNGLPIVGKGLSKDKFKLKMMEVGIFLKEETQKYIANTVFLAAPAKEEGGNDGGQPIEDDESGLPF